MWLGNTWQCKIHQEDFPTYKATFSSGIPHQPHLISFHSYPHDLPIKNQFCFLVESHTLWNISQFAIENGHRNSRFTY